MWGRGRSKGVKADRREQSCEGRGQKGGEGWGVLCRQLSVKPCSHKHRLGVGLQDPWFCTTVHTVIPVLTRREVEETAARKLSAARLACVQRSRCAGPCLEQKVEGRASRMAQWVDICHTDLTARAGS